MGKLWSNSQALKADDCWWTDAIMTKWLKISYLIGELLTVVPWWSDRDLTCCLDPVPGVSSVPGFCSLFIFFSLGPLLVRAPERDGSLGRSPIDNYFLNLNKPSNYPSLRAILKLISELVRNFYWNKKFVWVLTVNWLVLKLYYCCINLNIDSNFREMSFFIN